MDKFEWSVRYAMRDYFRNSNYATGKDYIFERFEPEKCDWKDGFNSSAVFGCIIYKDGDGKVNRSQSMVIKLTPNLRQKSNYVDIVFTNEIFMYKRIIPFYATLNNSILRIFPKFYYGNVVFGSDNFDNELIVLENLTASGFRLTAKKAFLDMEHLSLTMKALGKYHAYSYQAKSKHPQIFFPLVNNLRETHFSATKEIRSHLTEMNQYYLKFLETDARYSQKARKVGELLANAEAFLERTFTSREEPIAVLCHGDFLRNNLMFKYDENGKPVELKFIDLACPKYCTPIVDLALVLYMNTDQPTRDRHWHELLNAYYDSLTNTFPENGTVPTREQILAEFNQKSLNAWLLVTFFLKTMLLAEETDSTSDEEYYSPDYEEYLTKSWYDIPSYILTDIVIRSTKPRFRGKILQVLTDIMDRDFV